MQNFFFLKADKPMWPASANVFVIKDSEGLILIDVGCGLKKFIRKLYQQFKINNLDIKDIHSIVISHAHPDHMGGISWIFKDLKRFNIEFSDIKIYINKIEKKIAQNINLLNLYFDVPLISKYYNSDSEHNLKKISDINDNFKILCAMSQLPEDCNIQTFDDDDILNFGDYKFKILTTPGHAPGHTSFFELDRHFLLSGDLIGEKGTAWYSPSSGGAIGYLDSLKKIEKLSVSSVYPAHGNKFYNIKERITQIRNKILLKDQKIMEKLEKSPQKLIDLVKLFYNDSLIQIFPGVAIIESHLIKLEKEGKILRNGEKVYKI
ncbi:MAG: MBL fold metallo-hydrolase [Candidatus Helarchaeota archaeon]